MINIGALIILLALNTSCAPKGATTTDIEDPVDVSIGVVSPEPETSDVVVLPQSNEKLSEDNIHERRTIESKDKVEVVIDSESEYSEMEVPERVVIEKTEEAEDEDFTALTPQIDNHPKIDEKKLGTPKADVDNETMKKDSSADEDGSITPPEEIALHDAWHNILQQYVSDLGVVNYTGIQSNVADLNRYLAQLSDHTPSESDRSNEAKAFWINAYNAFTIKLIVSNLPVTSITKIDGGKPWDTKWIKLGGRTYSLNNIEHDILRPGWKDGRIHFAVNCAAKSCPPISNTAFTGQNADALLSKMTKVFINNTKYNKITSSSLQLSKIFEWYKDDFGSLVGFVNKYTTTEVSSDADITYIEYDWALNGE